MARFGRAYPIPRPLASAMFWIGSGGVAGITGTILLWTVPTTMANGDPLPSNFITGYRIYMGLTAESLSAALDVGPTPTEVPFESIPGAAIGKWFAVSALSPLGESAQTPASQWIATGLVPTGTMSGPRFAWVVPTLLANGDPLLPQDITGYRIYRGLTPGSLAAVLDIGPTSPEIIFSRIPGALVGHWFAVSAISAGGLSMQTQTIQWATRSTIITW